MTMNVDPMSNTVERPLDDSNPSPNGGTTPSACRTARAIPVRSSQQPPAQAAQEHHAWSCTLEALRQFSSPKESLRDSPDPFGRDQPGRAALRACTKQRGDLRTFTVTVLEQLSESLIALAWRDPTLCNYEEQIWSLAFARRSGRCALSGMHIRKGDTVYTPRTRGKTVPLNGDAMIQVSAVRKDTTPERCCDGMAAASSG